MNVPSLSLSVCLSPCPLWPADEEAAEGEDDDEYEGDDEYGCGNEERQPLVSVAGHGAALAHA